MSILQCFSAAFCICGERECATGSPNTPSWIGGSTSRVASRQFSRSASVYRSVICFFFIWRGTRCCAPKVGRDGARPSDSYSFRAELPDHPVEPREHALFPHHLQHVIKARADAATAHADARWMNEIAGFTAKFLRKRFESGFDFLHSPILDFGEFVA